MLADFSLLLETQDFPLEALHGFKIMNKTSYLGLDTNAILI